MYTNKQVKEYNNDSLLLNVKWNVHNFLLIFKLKLRNCSKSYYEFWVTVIKLYIEINSGNVCILYTSRWSSCYWSFTLSESVIFPSHPVNLLVWHSVLYAFVIPPRLNAGLRRTNWRTPSVKEFIFYRSLPY